jgi:glycerol-3-phosphate O-acyltransferase
MTVRSYLREPRLPVVFLPVYFGYERILEGPTYIGELSGKPKEKESVWGLLRAIRRLSRQRLGRVHVNLGEPIHLDALLDQRDPGWRAQQFDDQNRPSWVGPLVDTLAQRIMRHINAAASVTPINLLSLILLAMPRQAMLESDLQRQIDTMMAILRAVPYADRVTVTDLNAQQIVEYGLTLQVISREEHRSGNIIRMSAQHAVLATYQRNNVLHLFAMPSLIACCFLANAAIATEDVQRLAGRIYPYVAAELFLRWSEDEVPGVVAATLEAFAALGLLSAGTMEPRWQRPPSDTFAAMQLSLLSQTTVSTIERYYLAIALLIDAGSGSITQSLLEERCQLMAQRMTMLYGINSPEFFDRSLFENFIDLLRARNVVSVDGQGLLVFDEVLTRTAADAQLVLSEQIRHSILQVTHP